MEDLEKKSNTPDLILAGYYDNKEDANEQQQTFVEITKGFNFDVEMISYIGKKTSTTTKNTDYWGNPVKSETSSTTLPTQEKNAPTSSVLKVDF